MCTKLYEIAVRGDVDALMALLEEDPVILTRLITDFHENPIHVAVMCGHVDFVARVLSIKPELASETDLAQSSTLLHLASAGNNAEMVNVLLKVTADACKAIDRNGNIPIQVATMKGRVEIMQLLIDTCTESIRVLTSRKETLLHLCVKYNRLEALRLLVPLFLRADNDDNPEFVSVNSSNDEGNTILHLAVAMKQTEMIRYLLRKRDNLPEQERDNIMAVVGAINNINSNGFTALDILMQNPARDLNDVEIGDLLRNSGALITREQQLAVSPTHGHPRLRRVGGCNENCNEYDNWLTRKHNVLMVVASLIATMAFEAGLNPPGGIWQDNSVLKDHSGKPMHLAGTSILADNAIHIHFLYMISNTTGFLASLSIILLLISGLPLKKRFSIWILTAIMWVALTCTASTYFITLSSISARHLSKHGAPPVEVLKGWFITWIAFISILLFVHFLRLMSKRKASERN
ncbi:hypothetical protein C5167_014258 [Papaver somniferum]|uniref:PGG domain-containing protein n=1 Tax=Papaver somniferum TaxID=3469 RepID=A0A4Y7J2Q4_PAPSO|nr:ankyrin repeat-containing protein BDA1-like [Papaver somniferum]RZC55404.1 hypothetical protein C5167_014258 [Papaver somniferum]